MGWRAICFMGDSKEVAMARNRRDEGLRLGNQLCFAVYSTAHAFNRVYKPLLDALGLTYPQYLVMLTLWEQDGVTVGEIGERLFLDSGTLTPLLKRLEAAGLLRRDRDPADERQVRVGLTPAGQGLRDKARAVPPAVLCAAGMSVDELQALKDQIVRLRDRLSAAAG
jgi:DNA-binding MarR family transcriptional regulator